MIVTTIALSDDVHRRLSIAAIERNTVMTELVRQAVDAWLARSEKRPKGRPRVERT
jgi:predicted transcriptional regulator